MKQTKIMKAKKIILASNSPRRRELLAGLDISFEVKVIPGIDESYPEDLPAVEVPQYISKAKADAYLGMIDDDTMVITADTVVVLDDEILGKPVDDDDARRILHKLSGKTHQVITGVCLTSLDKQRVFAVTTGVTFKQFTEQEIDYYVSHYHPLDKAGAYGIQEWIGHIGVTALNGSYFNVMGLPVQRIYMEMQDF
jgi:septum formation protein